MVSIRYLLEKRRGVGGGRGGGGGVSRGGSSSSGSSSRGGSSSGSSGASGSTSRTGQPGRSISPYNSGGGSPRTIPAGTAFAGRQFGGLPRSQIYSGYGYGGGYGSFARGAAFGGVAGLGYGYVGGLGFPYGMWPLYYGPRYYGDDEYGPHSNSSRPGGPLAAASFSPPGSAAGAPPQYLIYGDADSISNATTALTEDCAAYTVIPLTYVQDSGAYPDGTNTTLLPALDPSNVLEYYRASSFALYSFFYDRQVNPNATVNYTEPISTQPYLYSASLRNATFQQCVNETLGDALPIEDGYVETSGALQSVALPTLLPLLLILSVFSSIF
ncbi:hypothetical protein JCM10908_004889 [Rhodotorula pacifica]|uniref:uncharacterized protein n=1 Tax=Rhodotorula pacifica TaxID=1495444 RepID=UPI003181CB1C